MNLPHLATDRLLLRPWRASDRLPFQEMNRDPQVIEFLPGPLTPEQSDAMVDRLEAHFEHEGFGLWAVEVPGVAPFIGFIGLLRVGFVAPFSDPAAPAVEIGWRLSPAFWGKGFATEGARVALDFAFSILKLAEVVSFTVPHNVRSRQVMVRIGMTQDLSGSFLHPRLPAGHPLELHVLYRLSSDDHQRRRTSA